MAEEEDNAAATTELDHQAAYIFNPLGDNEQEGKPRPAKRRKKSRNSAIATEKQPEKKLSCFVPLFNGGEDHRCTALREELFESAWSSIETRIQDTLRDANKNTLDEVGAFVREAAAKSEKIPAAYIITGPNTASQQLLFEQLSDSLQDLAKPAKFVSIRSAEAPNLKAVLKKIIRDATSRAEDDDDDNEIAPGKDGRKYLDYDLEALYAFLKPHGSSRVMVAFQDTEAFDSGLLSDLILLLNSWRDRLQFTLLFGIATSVELFQARLLKSTAQHLFGGQFDVVQASAVLDSVFKAGVAHADVMLRLGPTLLRGLIERQQEQVAGIQAFISSLKYAYMCHFYADPLSVLHTSGKKIKSGLLQPEHLEALRMLPSFRNEVKRGAFETGPEYARKLLDDDEFLKERIVKQIGDRKEYATLTMQALHLLRATGLHPGNFIDNYLDAITHGIDVEHPPSPFLILGAMRQLPAEEIISLMTRLMEAVRDGSPELGLAGWEEYCPQVMEELTELVELLTSLHNQAQNKGKTLRSKWSAQSKVLRTTVVAQKVQLSQDTAKLTADDNAFTGIIDRLEDILTQAIRSTKAEEKLFHETWLFDFQSPIRDVFIPRPGTTVERALSRPHDYLNCSCCRKAKGDTAASLPATAILYHLYVEAGALINVADLWSAFYALVGEENEEGGLDERTALVQFYQGLAELKAMGFVKQSKKKADHIAKVKWL